MEAFIDSLTADQIAYLARTLVWAVALVAVGIIATRWGVHWAKKHSVSQPPLKTRLFVLAGMLALLALGYVYSDALEPPILTTVSGAEGDKVVITGFWGLTKHDLVRLIGISIISLAAVVLILFGIRPFLRAAMTVPVPASLNSPALNWISGFAWLAFGFIGGAYFLFQQHQRFADQAPDPAMLYPGTGRLFLGLTKLQFLAVLEALVLWLIAILTLRFVVRRLWLTTLKMPGITMSLFVQKAVPLIGWTIGILFSLRVLWRIYQIATL